MGEYSLKFLELSVVIPDIPQKRLTYMFMKGLKDPIKGVVKPHEPQNLEEAIRKAKKVDNNTAK